MNRKSGPCTSSGPRRTRAHADEPVGAYRDRVGQFVVPAHARMSQDLDKQHPLRHPSRLHARMNRQAQLLPGGPLSRARA